MKDNDVDYPAFLRENPPDPAKIQRGIEAREQRRKAATPKTVVGIDDDIIAEFKQRVHQEQEYRQLINQALREWLIAKEDKKETFAMMRLAESAFSEWLEPEEDIYDEKS